MCDRESWVCGRAGAGVQKNKRGVIGGVYGFTTWPPIFCLFFFSLVFTQRLDRLLSARRCSFAPSTFAGVTSGATPRSIARMSSVGLQLVDLHAAAKQNDIEGLVKLLEEGAHIDKRDPYG